MKKILAVLLLAVSTSVFAQQAKQTKVRRADRDYKVTINDGGVPTDIFVISGSTGAVTIGPTAQGVTNQVYGSVTIGDTTDGQSNTLRLNQGNNATGGLVIARRGGLETHKSLIQNDGEVLTIKKFGSTTSFGRINFVGGDTNSNSSGFAWQTQGGSELMRLTTDGLVVSGSSSSGSWAHTSGTSSGPTLGGGSVVLVTAVPRNFGGTDTRWASSICYYMNSSTNGFGCTSLASITSVISITSGGVLQYSGGGGTPITTVYYYYLTK